jgi:ABC-type multidrug transport system fused ATPase/permease subunit
LKELHTIRRLLPLLRGHRRVIPATILLGLLSSLAEGVGISLFAPLLESLDQAGPALPAPSWLEGILAPLLAGAPAGNRLYLLVAAILVLTLCKSLLAYADSALAARINSRITHDLRRRTFSKMLGLSQRALDRSEPGRLINLLATDTWSTSDALSLLLGLVVNLCSIAVFSILLVALSWRLSVLVVAGVALISLLLHAFSGSARGLGRQAVEANTALSTQMLDGLDGVQVIQMFRLQDHRRGLFEAVSERARSIHLRLDLLHRALPPLSELLYVGLLLGILLAGVALENSLPTLVVFLLLLYRLQPQIRQLDSSRLSLVSLSSPVGDLLRFLDAAPEPRPARAGAAPVRLDAEIRFDEVTFSYEDGDGFRLDRVSFRIPQGKTTAIVGPSGSGKSTIVSLLCRFREPVSGEILVDGRPLADLDVEAWRRQIAWAGQEAYLFSASARENIRDGGREASDERVVEAAILADADSFLRKLPEGYDTNLGNGGMPLSGGQTQRLSLARAFLRQPAILILDEATSALDSISEEGIQRYLRQRPGEQTVIVISHRLSTVRHADQVVVLNNGRVSEQGSPAELLERRGFLARVRELQNV